VSPPLLGPTGPSPPHREYNWKIRIVLVGMGGWVVVSPSGDWDRPPHYPAGSGAEVFCIDRCQYLGSINSKGQGLPILTSLNHHLLDCRPGGSGCPPNCNSEHEPPTSREAGPACSVSVDSSVAGQGDLSVADADEARGLRWYLLACIGTTSEQWNNFQ